VEYILYIHIFIDATFLFILIFKITHTIIIIQIEFVSHMYVDTCTRIYTHIYAYIVNYPKSFEWSAFISDSAFDGEMSSLYKLINFRKFSDR